MCRGPDSPQAYDGKFAGRKEANGDVTARGRRRKKTEEGDGYQILRKKTEQSNLTGLARPSESSFRPPLTAQSMSWKKVLSNTLSGIAYHACAAHNPPIRISWPVREWGLAFRGFLQSLTFQ
jgi:hypothetical protein